MRNQANCVRKVSIKIADSKSMAKSGSLTISFIQTMKWIKLKTERDLS